MQESDTLVMGTKIVACCVLAHYRAHGNNEQICKDNHLPFIDLLKEN